MFANIFTRKNAETYSEKIRRLRKALDDAEAVIVGAGAGLSTSAGFTYDGERFEKYFSDFGRKYGFDDMYSGGFYPYDTLEEHWAYWSRYIWINRYTDAPKPVYEELFALVKDRDYFVLTTNVDHCFQKAGFNKKRLFYTQGDYGLFQCSGPCCQETWDNEETVRRMLEEQKDMRIPSELIPRCPHCGKPLTIICGQTIPSFRIRAGMRHQSGIWHSQKSIRGRGSSIWNWESDITLRESSSTPSGS